MSIVILRVAALLYALGASGYVLYFARPRHKAAATFGFWALGTGFVVHAAAIGAGCAEFGGREFFGLRGGIVLLVWLLTGAYLLVHRIYRLPSLGAFVSPFALVLLVPALFGTPGHPEIAPEMVRHPAITIHIVSAVLGVALFAIAFGVGLMYLLQEREVKGKRFGVLFSRLPSLDALDQMGQRLVRLGFVVFSVALVAGTVTATSVWKSAWSWDPQQIVSVGVWVLYGAMVQLRHAGWHGRRYAVMTLVGFVIVLGSMLTMKMVPGITRHTGDYGLKEPPAEVRQ
jgi:ABC-type transport system involved in cytochrome c biogenesis permease subunit